VTISTVFHIIITFGLKILTAPPDIHQVCESWCDNDASPQLYDWCPVGSN